MCEMKTEWPQEQVVEDQLATVAITESSTGTESCITWHHEQVLLLLSLYAEHKDKFLSPAYKQNTVWQLIANQMAATGYDCDGRHCNEKFRALKYRHRLIAKSGNRRRKWPYFDMMEELTAGDTAVQPIILVASSSQCEMTEPEVEEQLAPIATTEGTGISWQHDQVLFLLSLYAEHKDKFLSPAYKQNAVWQLIANQMAAEGYSCDARHCNEKFRSLKYRHKHIIEANAKSGYGRRKWAFFDIMEELTAGDPSLQPIGLGASSSQCVQIKNKVRTPGSWSCVRPISPKQTASTPATSQTPTPQTASTTASSQTSSSRKRRGESQEPPVWFREYATGMNQRFSNLEAATNRLVAVEESRNALFQQLIDVLKNKNK